MYQDNPHLEEYAMGIDEGIFIKNLENVQGDERDIILFSIGYGPDEEGKVAMNFGPLNREGGWRRLNVAVTRARYEMKIFSSLRSEQIDLNRTKSEGVKGLKEFLNFAEKGTYVLKQNTESNDSISIVNVIADYLRNNNLKVEHNIGTSAYKVDIGIVNPNNDKEYIMGILIDGETYLNINTTNDRELLTPNVLKGLGWNIYRIWTLDWVKNKDKILASIVEKVQQYSSGDSIVDSTQSEAVVVEKVNENIVAEPILEEIKFERMMQLYESANLRSVRNANSETIYLPENRNTISNQIKSIVEVEGPISKTYLLKKLTKHWNVTKTGAKLNTYLNTILESTLGVLRVSTHQEFYWIMGGVNPANMSFYRDNSIEKRTVEDIAQEELQVAIMEIVHTNLSLSRADLVRVVARTFGFNKVGAQIETVVNLAVDVLIRTGRLQESESRLLIK